MNKKTIIASMLALGIFGAMLAGCGAQQSPSSSSPSQEQVSMANNGSESLADVNGEDPTEYLVKTKETFTELPSDIDKGVLIGKHSDLTGATGTSNGGENLTAFIYKTDKSPADVSKELNAYLKSNGFTDVNSGTIGEGEYIASGDKDGKSYAFQIYTKAGKTIVNTLVSYK